MHACQCTRNRRDPRNRTMCKKPFLRIPNHYLPLWNDDYDD